MDSQSQSAASWIAFIVIGVGILMAAFGILYLVPIFLK